MNTRTRLALFVVAGLAVAAALAFFVSPLASSSPDGLERVAADQGFIDTASDSAVADSPLADYAVRGVADEGLSTGAAGLVGVALCFVLAGGLALAVRHRSSSSRDQPAAASSASGD